MTRCHNPSTNAVRGARGGGVATPAPSGQPAETRPSHAPAARRPSPTAVRGSEPSDQAQPIGAHRNLIWHMAKIRRPGRSSRTDRWPGCAQEGTADWGTRAKHPAEVHSGPGARQPRPKTRRGRRRVRLACKIRRPGGARGQVSAQQRTSEAPNNRAQPAALPVGPSAHTGAGQPGSAPMRGAPAQQSSVARTGTQTGRTGVTALGIARAGHHPAEPGERHCRPAQARVRAHAIQDIAQARAPAHRPGVHDPAPEPGSQARQHTAARARHQPTGPNPRLCRYAKTRARAHANPGQRPCEGASAKHAQSDAQAERTGETAPSIARAAPTNRAHPATLPAGRGVRAGARQPKPAPRRGEGGPDPMPRQGARARQKPSARARGTRQQGPAKGPADGPGRRHGRTPTQASARAGAPTHQPVLHVPAPRPWSRARERPTARARHQPTGPSRRPCNKQAKTRGPAHANSVRRPSGGASARRARSDAQVWRTGETAPGSARTTPANRARPEDLSTGRGAQAGARQPRPAPKRGVWRA